MADSLFISPVGLNGLSDKTPDSGSFTYLYGLSNFWVEFFQDSELVESLLEAYTIQLGDIYGRFLQLAGNISLASIQESYNSQLSLLRIGTDTSVDTISGITYKLSQPISNIRYLMNRPILPTMTLLNGTHFELSDDGTEITFYRPLRDLAFPKRPRSDGVEEYAIWASDIEIDEGVLHHQYGALVDVTPEQAIGRYKDFLQGLYYLYSHGPTIDKIISGLNLALGLPSARATERVLTVVQNPDTGHWIVITPTYAYEIPYGFRPDLSENSIIQTGQQLCSWVEIKDWYKDGKWWMYSYIPKEILHGQKLPVATPGNVTDRVMSDYLKNHTFMVLLKQGGISLDAYGTVADIVDRVKPSYTFPIYVWQAPLGEELVDLHDDFTYILDVGLEDIFGPGLAIDEFVRNDKKTQFYRGVNWYNRYQTPTYVQRMMGDLPEPGNEYGVLEDGTVLSGIGGWVPEFEHVGEIERYRFNACIRSRDDITMPRTRSTAIRGWRSVNMDHELGLVWSIPSPDVFPFSGKTYQVNERQLLPLYTCTEDEINDKFKVANIAFTTKKGGKIKAFKDVYVRRFFDIFIKRNDKGTPIKAPDQMIGEGVEEVFHFELTNGVTDPAMSKWQSMAYVPSLKSLPEKADIIVAEVFRYTWAVYLVIAGDPFLAPTYFPVDNRDTIDVKVEFDYDTITAEKPAVINRSTVGLEPSFLMDRSRARGKYDNGHDPYILYMNRSGKYGPDDEPLVAYKKV